MRKQLEFNFCDNCKKLMDKGIKPLGFKDFGFCDKICKEKFKDNKLFSSNFKPFWDDLQRVNFINSIDDLQEILKMIKLTEDKELINLKQQSLKSKKERNKLLEDIKILELKKDRIKEEVKESWFGRKINLSHPDKCMRCDRIDPRGNFLFIIPKSKGGEDSADNKIFVCHKCFISVQIYLDDLISIYHDPKIIKKFVITENSLLDKPLGINRGIKNE